MRYRVMDGEKPAILLGGPNGSMTNPYWSKYEYDNWEEALTYALQWLGEDAPQGKELELDTRYYYSDEDYIIIERIGDEAVPN